MTGSPSRFRCEVYEGNAKTWSEATKSGMRRWRYMHVATGGSRAPPRYGWAYIEEPRGGNGEKEGWCAVPASVPAYRARWFTALDACPLGLGREHPRVEVHLDPSVDAMVAMLVSVQRHADEGMGEG